MRANILADDEGELPARARATLDAIFTSWEGLRKRGRTTSFLPGLAIGILSQGKLVYERYAGMARSGQDGIPVGPNTVFELSSVSKQFTATCVVIAAASGALSLDDPVARWGIECSQPGIRIRHLLHHTSGLPDLFALFPHDQRFDTQMALRRLSTASLLEPPGSTYRYNNSGYLLAAVILSRATGLSLDSFAQAHLFGPLGMTTARFGDMATRATSDPACAFGYNLAPGATIAALDYQLDVWPRGDGVGAGGALMSMIDLARWDSSWYQNQLRPEFVNCGKDLQPIVRVLTTCGRFDSGARAGLPVISSNSDEGYACGLEVGTYGDRRIVWHNGGSWGFRSILLRHPDDGITVLLLTNAGTAFDAWLSREGYDRPPNLSIRNLASRIANLVAGREQE
jgi:CubicO group peptidase (beta-lactamase class C family)